MRLVISLLIMLKKLLPESGWTVFLHPTVVLAWRPPFHCITRPLPLLSKYLSSTLVVPVIFSHSQLVKTFSVVGRDATFAA